LVREINDVDVAVNFLLKAIVAFDRVLDQIFERGLLHVPEDLDELVVIYLVHAVPVLLVRLP